MVEINESTICKVPVPLMAGRGSEDGVYGLAEIVVAGTVPVVFCRTDPKEKDEKWPD